MGTFNDLAGLRFGRLVAIRVVNRGLTKNTRWECRCDCGNTSVHTAIVLRSGATVSCGCFRKANNKSVHWTGCGDISGTYWKNIRHGARDRGHLFQLSIEQAWALFERQEHRCALSGLPLTLIEPGRTGSLDRIDSGVGYALDNVQWIHRDINQMKHRFQQDQFIRMCRAIAEHNAEADALSVAD